MIPELASPVIDQQGTILLPLRSGEWDLMILPDGTVAISCLIPNMQTGNPERYIMELGEIFEELEPLDLIDGFNFTRSGGQTEEAPN